MRTCALSGWRVQVLLPGDRVLHEHAFVERHEHPHRELPLDEDPRHHATARARGTTRSHTSLNINSVVQWTRGISTKHVQTSRGHPVVSECTGCYDDPSHDTLRMHGDDAAERRAFLRAHRQRGGQAGAVRRGGALGGLGDTPGGHLRGRRVAQRGREQGGVGAAEVHTEQVRASVYMYV